MFSQSPLHLSDGFLIERRCWIVEAQLGGLIGWILCLPHLSRANQICHCATFASQWWANHFMCCDFDSSALKQISSSLAKLSEDKRKQKTFNAVLLFQRMFRQTTYYSLLHKLTASVTCHFLFFFGFSELLQAPFLVLVNPLKFSDWVLKMLSVGSWQKTWDFWRWNPVQLVASGSTWSDSNQKQFRKKW